jgi:Helix-turn-helix.
MKTETLLKQEFLKRKKKNPSYSLRAFAQSIGISSGRVSEIFNGKRTLTAKNAAKVLENLKLDLGERKKWQNLIEGSAPSPTRQLEEAQFCLIADPIHYAILCLMETQSFYKMKLVAAKKRKSVKASLLETEIQWMSERLEKPRMEIELALQNLELLQFVNSRDGHYILTLEEGLETTTEVPSKALRESHKKSLHRALEKIDTVAIEDRSVTSMTMAIDVKNLPEAKRLIKEFRLSLSQLLETGTKSEVYDLNIQLIPVTALE